MSKLDKRMEFDGEYETTIPVTIIWEPFEEDDAPAGYLIAYDDGEMQDGFDYSEYEERLIDGESFEDVCRDLIEELRDTR